jgi:hypothetical protein
MKPVAKPGGKRFASKREYDVLAVKAKNIIGKKTGEITSVNVAVIVKV